MISEPWMKSINPFILDIANVVDIVNFWCLLPSIVATRGAFSKANYLLKIEIVSMDRSTEFKHSLIIFSIFMHSSW